MFQSSSSILYHVYLTDSFLSDDVIQIQVHGFVEDVMGKNVATIFGKWDESMYYINGDRGNNMKDCSSSSDTSLFWKRTKPPVNLTRYNLTSFAITLNELTEGLQEKLPPTDSRLRPDQRHLENGEYEKTNAEKQHLEKRQRMSRKLQESGWKPQWFKREGKDGPSATWVAIGSHASEENRMNVPTYLVNLKKLLLRALKKTYLTRTRRHIMTLMIIQVISISFFFSLSLT
ncbi:oxysterol-binding protein-related protein 2A-like [Cannabis sativa]|uniref:oxysterol-binding protein-related protein 2A-like n=1 Tax=Cannabis sativa TaxID=3483 RepID=UPI0029CA3A06|nr:oxysterol-binding protein-related protein 2A-like [Cannabis sativa]